MRVADTVAPLCVALLGATAVALARQLPYEAEYGPGPGFLPFWLGVALIVLAVLLLREAWMARQPSDAAEGAVVATPASFLQFGSGALTPWLIFLASTIAVSLFLELLGFWLSIALFMFVTMRWVAGQSWRSTIAFAIVTPVVFYLGFVRLLMVPLPMQPAWL